MKYLVYAGIIALLVLILLPAGVIAAESDTVMVSGSIGLSMDVSAAPDDIIFGSMVSGTDSFGSTLVTVVTTGTSWSVLATDVKTTNKGYMTTNADGTGKKLANPFQISNDGTTFSPLTPSYSFMSGTSAGTFSDTADVKQAIELADSSGNYQITVTFPELQVKDYM